MSDIDSNLSRRKVLWPPKQKWSIHRSTIRAAVRKVLRDRDRSKKVKTAKGKGLV